MMQAALPAGIRFGVLRKSSSSAFRQTGEVFYIGGADVLPAPLEEQEEAKAIAGKKRVWYTVLNLKWRGVP